MPQPSLPPLPPGWAHLDDNRTDADASYISRTGRKIRSIHEVHHHLKAEITEKECTPAERLWLRTLERHGLGCRHYASAMPAEDLPEPPTFYPTVADFVDPGRYFRSILSQINQYGICKVVPPASWSPQPWSGRPPAGAASRSVFGGGGGARSVEATCRALTDFADESCDDPAQDLRVTPRLQHIKLFNKSFEYFYGELSLSDYRDLCEKVWPASDVSSADGELDVAAAEREFWNLMAYGSAKGASAPRTPRHANAQAASPNGASPRGQPAPGMSPGAPPVATSGLTAAPPTEAPAAAVAAATSPTATGLLEGQWIYVHGLSKRTELNGQRGFVNSWDNELSRYRVLMQENSKMLALRAKNLVPLNPKKTEATAPSPPASPPPPDAEPTGADAADSGGRGPPDGQGPASVDVDGPQRVPAGHDVDEGAPKRQKHDHDATPDGEPSGGTNTVPYDQRCKTPGCTLKKFHLGMCSSEDVSESGRKARLKKQDYRLLADVDEVDYGWTSDAERRHQSTRAAEQQRQDQLAARTAAQRHGGSVLEMALGVLREQAHGSPCSLYASDLPYVGPQPPADVDRGELTSTRTRSGVMDSLLRSSILRFAPTTSGVNYPMMYVGARNTFFCWHVEDNLLYATNYVHSGAPKIWYAVPPISMEAMEVVWRKNFPKLFERHPDLQYWKTCIFSPMVLRAHGIPVYRTVAEPGSFIFTLPGAYHCGINTGFNVAESSNFAFPAWVPTGAYAVDRYREPPTRDPTLLHDALLCSVLRHSNPREVRQLLCEVQRAIDAESKARAELRRTDVIVPDEEALPARPFDANPEEEGNEWRCRVCRHLCYFSVVRCGCAPSENMLCPRHALHTPPAGSASEPQGYIHLDDNPGVVNLEPLRAPQKRASHKVSAPAAPPLLPQPPPPPPPAPLVPLPQPAPQGNGAADADPTKPPINWYRFECDKCNKRLKAPAPAQATRIKTKCINCGRTLIKSIGRLESRPAPRPAQLPQEPVQQPDPQAAKVEEPPPPSASRAAPMRCACLPAQRRLEVRHPLAQLLELVHEARGRAGVAEGVVCAAEPGAICCGLHGEDKVVQMSDLWPTGP